MRLTFCMGLVVLALAACASPRPAQPNSAATSNELTRAAVVEHAYAFAKHRWSASGGNAFHGEDEWGNRIDTPDRVGSGLATGWSHEGEPNIGVSYQWGGWSSLAEFESGVAQGKWAGHLPTSGQSFFTDAAVGVDCSGLISRVWRLPRKQSTRSLPQICTSLASYDDLRPGDILNRVGRHTMLFVEFVDGDTGRLRVIESTVRQGRVHESVHQRSELQRRGYQALRYPPLATR